MDDSDDKKPRLDPVAWHSPSPSASFLGPRGLPVGNSDELTRVINLPRRPVVTEGSPTAEALINIGMRRYSRGPRTDCRCAEIDPVRAEKAAREGRKPCIEKFRWVQAWMLHEIGVVNGLIANVSVGGGKTLVGVLAPLALRNCPLCLLVIPSTLVDQIIVDYQLYAEHFRVPGIVVHLPGKRSWCREPQPAPGGVLEPMLHVIPYSKMSGTDNSDWIERLQPNAIIADEVDSLADIGAARTMRLMRYYSEFDETRFCGWTGSLTDSSVSEYAHLAALALRDGSPLPLDSDVIDEWSRCLDAVPNPCPPGALIRLLEPGEKPSQIRRAFNRRLAETAGCIMVGGKQTILTSTGAEVELKVRERSAPPIPDIVNEALAKVRMFCRPDTLIGADDDEILVDPMEQARCAREVATGVFYRWIFPRGESKPVIKEWYAARKAWNSELRYKMMRGERQLDSQALCEAAAMRAWGQAPRDANLPEWRAENWPRWCEVMDTVKPKTKAERLHPFLVEDACEWASRDVGIVWYMMVEFAQWMGELSGLPIHGGGPGAGARIMKERGDTSIIASIKSHGRGRDRLQYSFARQLVANVPASDRMWQQLLGRLDRPGQESVGVDTLVYQHVPEIQTSLKQALMRGKYVHETTGEERKLLSAWSPDETDEA